MKLGEFRKLTENLSDDIDIVVCQMMLKLISIM